MSNNIEAVIFDLGGTLINYEGFPSYWGDYYEQAFQNVSDKLILGLPEQQIRLAADTLKKYNPRLHPRENEYTPAQIFTDAFKGWNITESTLNDAIRIFFELFQRNVLIYPETVSILTYLKESGIKIGILTDVPTGMPTEIIIKDIGLFKDQIDYFLSSIDCGVRKPNKKGIEMIAESFGVNKKHIAFVGDEEKDIGAAKNAGIRSILINREEEKKCYGEDVQIKSLTEMAEILKCDFSPHSTRSLR